MTARSRLILGIIAAGWTIFGGWHVIRADPGAEGDVLTAVVVTIALVDIALATTGRDRLLSQIATLLRRIGSWLGLRWTSQIAWWDRCRGRMQRRRGSWLAAGMLGSGGASTGWIGSD